MYPWSSQRSLLFCCGFFHLLSKPLRTETRIFLFCIRFPCGSCKKKFMMLLRQVVLANWSLFCTSMLSCELGRELGLWVWGYSLDNLFSKSFFFNWGKSLSYILTFIVSFRVHLYIMCHLIYRWSFMYHCRFAVNLIKHSFVLSQWPCVLIVRTTETLL